MKIKRNILFVTNSVVKGKIVKRKEIHFVKS